jgi:hypothetical protein
MVRSIAGFVFRLLYAYRTSNGKYTYNRLGHPKTVVDVVGSARRGGWWHPIGVGSAAGRRLVDAATAGYPA